ncbi:DNA polymerase III subunit delta [Rhizobium sp. L1K21]|uniref:DNA polymerase III subunit delta n=1 Tax=Rhizobium sp. L1K21 TaxID=2954933 RepID=UPI0020926CDF|nr:DNA polymerase III subunit delta [Rhizobium sp. L1K21]MCO6188013.1 DNA polymerase III subunit delta [Rhizobium sp. L1K21]
MTELKSHDFDRLLASSASLPRILLFFGPDLGLVSERAQKSATRTGVPLDDPFAVVHLTANDLTSDTGRLVDEANSIGLFGGEKLIWIKGAANEKQLLDGLNILCEDLPNSTWIIIEAADLKKNAALRKLAATQRNITSVPCYADDTKALNTLLDEILQQFQLRISSAARSILLSQLGGDRKASRNEIEKLALYCLNEDVIEEHHVTAIIGDASGLSVDDAVNAVLSGDKSGLLHAVRKISASKTPIFLVLQGVLRQFQMIDSIRAEMDEGHMAPPAALAKYARGLHFKKRPIIERALSTWPAASVKRELERLQSCILQSRQNASIEESVALQLLLSITLQSARLNARR